MPGNSLSVIVHRISFWRYFSNTRYTINDIRAFTLVELLVSILILLAISVVAIPNIKKFNQDQEVEEAANNVINVLRLAQSNAMSSIKCSGILASSIWNAEFQKTTFKLTAICSNDSVSYSVITLIDSTNYVKDRAGLVEVSNFGAGCANTNTLSVRFTGNTVSGFCDITPVYPGNPAYPGTPINPSSPIEINLRNTQKLTSVKKIIIEKGGVINKQ